MDSELAGNCTVPRLAASNRSESAATTPSASGRRSARRRSFRESRENGPLANAGSGDCRPDSARRPTRSSAAAASRSAATAGASGTASPASDASPCVSTKLFTRPMAASSSPTSRPLGACPGPRSRVRASPVSARSQARRASLACNSLPMHLRRVPGYRMLTYAGTLVNLPLAGTESPKTKSTRSR
jgi:hypothetical protein